MSGGSLQTILSAVQLLPANRSIDDVSLSRWFLTVEIQNRVPISHPLVFALVAVLSCCWPAAAQTVLQNHIIWSIAHEGCSAFSGNTLNPPETMRGCFLAKEVRNAEATTLLRVVPPDQLADNIRQSLTFAYDQYQIPANFEWVLSHENQLELFRELGRSKDYRQIRTIYYRKQQHNPNAKNVLSAISDVQIQELLDRRRAAVAINSETSYETLRTIDSLSEPKITTTQSPLTLASLLNDVYGSTNASITKLVLEKNPHLRSGSGIINSVDFQIPVGTNIILPSLPRVGRVESIPLQPLSGNGACPTCAVIDPRLMTFVELRQNGTPIEPEIFGHIEIPVGKLQSVSQPTAVDFGWYLESLGINSIDLGDLKLSWPVPVAVVDSGADTAHPDLIASFWSTPSAVADARWPAGALGYDFIRRSTNPTDENAESHGTHVSGLVVGEQMSKWKPDIAKMLANNLRLVELKIVGPHNVVDSGTVQNAILAGIGKGVKIFNCSFELATESEMLKTYMKTTDRVANTLFVVAAGNNGDGDNKGANLDLDEFRQETFKDGSVPLSDVILVAALEKNGKIASFSIYGPKTVTIAAPGSNISSTIRNHAYGLLSGTSQAAPFVSLTAAILLSELPSLSLPEIHQRIVDTCDWIPDLKPYVRDGCRLNIQKAAIINADLLQLKSGAILKGTIPSSQVSVPGTTQTSRSHKLERIWFDDNGQITIVATDGRFASPPASLSTVTIELTKPSQCVGHVTGNSCVIPVSLVRDIVFRASSM